MTGRSGIYAVLLVFSQLLLVPADGRGEWRAEPGTVKVYGRWNHYLPPGIPSQIPQELLDRWNAVIVYARATHLVMQVPAGNAVSLRTALEPWVNAQIEENFDILAFYSFPIDARLPPPEYPEEWRRLEPLAPPARDAFIIQFPGPPEGEWVQDLRATGDVLEYAPYNGYLVLGEKAALERLVARLPVQVFRLHQPVHRILPHLRQLRADGAVHADVIVSIAGGVPARIARAQAARSLPWIPQATLRSSHGKPPLTPFWT